MKLFMLVSNDDLELPIKIERKAKALALYLGVDAGKVRCSAYRSKHHSECKKYKKEFCFASVEIPDEDVELVTDDMWMHYKEWREKCRR